MVRNDLLIIVIFIITFLFVILRAVKRVNKRQKNICARCEGTGFIRLGKEEETCNRCKGTGELGNYLYRHNSRSQFR